MNSHLREACEIVWRMLLSISEIRKGKESVLSNGFHIDNLNILSFGMIPIFQKSILLFLYIFVFMVVFSLHVLFCFLFVDRCCLFVLCFLSSRILSFICFDCMLFVLMFCLCFCCVLISAFVWKSLFIYIKVRMHSVNVQIFSKRGNNFLCS